MISKELQQTIEDWYVLKTYGEVYENLHRDIQADIDHHFDATGQYGQVLSNNDWAALCKEWANDNGYFIHIRNDHRIGRTKYTAEAGTDLSSVFGVEGFYGEDEVDVTFRACQWILDNKDNK